MIKNLQGKKAVLEIKLEGYATQNILIEQSETLLDLGIILLFKEVEEIEDLSIITLTDDELNEDAGSADNISGLLQSSMDIFLRIAAFEFSASFFKVKGLILKMERS